MKMLICCQNQFGYHIDTFYYSKYLSKSFDVTYFCWDYGLQRIECNGVNVKYNSRAGSIALRNIKYIKNLANFINLNNFDFVFVKYFKGSSLLKLLCPNTNFLLDIRTGAVNEKGYIRFFEDYLLRFESLFFSNISIVSDSLAVKLKLNPSKYWVLPLGAEKISNKDIYKGFNFHETLNIIYVGTLTGRNIDVTIEALYHFRLRNPLTNFNYRIIGTGTDFYKSKIIKAIDFFKLNDCVSLLGFISHAQLSKVFEETHIGVAYIPMTGYFDVQPSTKIYEYLLSKIPVIATKTTENRILITEKNGVLVEGDSMSFCFGVEALLNKISNHEIEFRELNHSFEWLNVVSILENYIRRSV